MTAYIAIIPFLLASLLKDNLFTSIVKYYHYVILVLLSLVITSDLASYGAWGFRLDVSILDYLSHPKEALASTLTAPWMKLSGTLLLLIASGVWLMKYLFSRPTKLPSWWLSLLFIILLILPIRGGLGIAPLNPSAVYFSENQFSNKAALNAAWNFMYSAMHRRIKKNPYVAMKTEDAIELLDSLTNSREQDFSALNQQRPDIILVLWESLSSKILHAKYNGVEILPTLNQLSRNSIFFSEFYASGDRTEKGLAAVLSGYPAQALTSIVKETKKVTSLPSLAAELKPLGYTSRFIYGGDLEFAGMGAYVRSMPFDEIYTKNDFERSQQNSKWGAHDEFIFAKSLEDLGKRDPLKPVFQVILTITSHEPFEIPVNDFISGKDELSLFYNAHRYTDGCLANYISALKKTGNWENTLLIVMGDHGHRLPHTDKKMDDFRIPMIWSGGAIAAPILWGNVSGQTDLSKTILKQLGLSGESFRFSKNSLSDKGPHWAYFSFNNGFGYVDASGKVIYDNGSKLPIEESTAQLPLLLRRGKAIQQLVTDDYLKR